MDINKMLRQAQAMQKNMNKISEQLSNTVYEGQASNGLVKVSVKGDYQVQNITLDPSIIDVNEKEMLEDLIVIALNDALTKIKKDSDNQMSSVTGGLKIPGLF